VTSKRKWAARAAVLGMSASVLVGVSVGAAGSASAQGSTCTPPGPNRPSGPITLALRPLFGDPGYNNGALPLGDTPFIVTGLLDSVVCQLLP
jgi:hypothetical protein